MNLVHFSKAKFAFDKERKYVNTFASPNFKPHGLWVSDESADMCWSHWCRENNFNEQNLEYQTELDVALSEVLLLQSKRDIELFQLVYRPSTVKDSALATYWPSNTSFLFIDWGKVAKEHKGIIITPYLWEFRVKFDYIWYYGWDCAGGCIWDLSCIKLVNT
jgi:outer membrane protease